MVNTHKTIKRERTRLRKSQNPQQLDFKKMRKAQKIKTKYWATKQHETASEKIVAKDTKQPKKDKKEKPKKDKKPELEVVEDEPELEVIDEELEELYDFDDEEAEEDLEDEDTEEDLEEDNVE